MIKVKIPSYYSEADNNGDITSSPSRKSSIGSNETTTTPTTKVVNGNTMPASIVLTHFCETHGPSVVFTTLTERILEINNIDLSTLNIDENHDLNQPISLPTLFSKNRQQRDHEDEEDKDEEDDEDDEFKTYSVLISNNSGNSSSNNNNETTDTTTTPILKQCPTCSSIPQGTGLVSQDSSNKNVYYISTHQTSNQSYYSVIRNACVRSLSCEAVPGREGPVLISSNDGHWLSYMFKINDSRARGSARWYGFLCLLKDTSCLVNYYSWLISSFKLLAEEMKRKTNIVYEREKSQQSHNSSMISNIYRRGTRSVPLKLFTELIEDPLFFTRLHKSFSSILSNCQFKYHLLKGNQALLSEQYETIQYFKETLKINNNNNNNNNNNININGIDLKKLGKNSTNSNNTTNTTTTSSTPQSNVSGFSLNLNMLNDSNIGLLENSFFPKQEELITSLGQIHRIMGEDAFSILIYNIIIGNQVIIRGSNEKLVSSMVGVVKELLPKECLNVCYYSDIFKEQWESNILGLNTNAVIPRHIDKDTSSIIDIDYYDLTKEPEDIDHPYRSTIEITCTGTKFPTTLGNSIESIYKQYCSTTLENVQLKSIKEEWINKSKSFYSVKTIIENEKDKRLYSFLNIINCLYEKDMEILMFWSMCSRKWFIQFNK